MSLGPSRMCHCSRRMYGDERSPGRAPCQHAPIWRALEEQRGQATVEAAVVLPTLMLLFGLLLQPVCLSYTRSVMRAAAAECARAATTAYGGDMEPCRQYALRRLKAVPEVPLFHVGGPSDWGIEIDRSGKQVHVGIRGHARPLPLLGLLASAALQRDGMGLVLAVELDESTHPSWLGGDYGAWQGIWG